MNYFQSATVLVFNLKIWHIDFSLYLVMKIGRKKAFLILLHNCVIFLYRICPTVTGLKDLPLRDHDMPKFWPKKKKNGAFIDRVLSAITPALLEQKVLIRFTEIILTF